MVALFHLDVLSHVWGVPLLRNAYLFVDFFFVLSGFVISHAYGARLSTLGEFAQFMLRRFGRVWPLHCVVLIAFIGLELVKLGISHASGIVAGSPPFDPHGRASLANLPSNMLLLHALGFDDRLTWNLPSWSISAEFWTYVVFGVLSLAVPRLRMAALGGLALISLALLVTSASHGMDATFDLGLPRAILGFALGHFVYAVRQRRLEFSPTTLAALEWAALALSITFVILAGNGPLSFAAPFIFTIAVYVFSFEAGAVSKALLRTPFRSLGLWSYSIYMVHDFAAYALSLALSAAEKRFGLNIWHDVSLHGGVTRVADLGSSYANDALTISYLGIVIGLSALTYQAVEQPGRRAFNRLAVNLAARQAAA